MTALFIFNGVASWRNAENSLQSVNLTMLVQRMGFISDSAEAILIEPRDMLNHSAAQLLEEETLSGDQLAAIVGSPARQPSTSTAD